MNKRAISGVGLVLVVTGAVLLSACLTGVQCPPPSSSTAAKLGHPLSKANATTTCSTTGGGGGGNGNCTSGLTPNDVIYTLDANGNILEYAISAVNGDLMLMCNTAITSPVGQLAVSTNNFLYVFAPGGSPEIFAFSIAHGGSGALSAVAGSPFKITLANLGAGATETLSGTARVAPDPLGRFLYVTNFDDNLIHVFAISTTTPGALAEVTNSPFSFPSPNGLVMDATGTFAFVPDDLDGKIQILTVSATGQLAAASGSPFVVGQNSPDSPHFAILDATNTFVFTANNSSISAFTFDPNSGQMFLVAGTPVSTSPSQITPDELAVDASGSFLFADDLGTNGLTGFLINATTGEIGPATVPGAPQAWPIPNQQTSIGILASPLTANIYTLNLASGAATTTGVVNTFGITAGTGQLLPPAANSTLVASQTMVTAHVQ
jgi:6-phosphogluconolactonase